MFTEKMSIPCYGPIYDIMLTHHLFCLKLKASPFIKVISAASERQHVWIFSASPEKIQ